MELDARSKLMLLSAMGMLAKVHLIVKKEPMTLNQTEAITSYLLNAIDQDDPTDWENVKHEMLYDDYLDSRTAAGTVTAIDLTRPGLVAALFNDDVEYWKHCLRISEKRKKEDAINGVSGYKECAECGKLLPLIRYKKRGGSKCNSCRSRLYRARVKAREEGEA